MESGLTSNPPMGQTADSKLPQATPDAHRQDIITKSEDTIDNAGLNQITPESKPENIKTQTQSSKLSKALSIVHRNFGKRLFLSMIITFCACFTFLFFGPVEITAFSQDSLHFTVYNIAPVMAVFALAVCLATSFIISIFKETIHNRIITGVFSFLFCGYIQGNLLSGKMGALDGNPVQWHTQKTEMLLDFFIWFMIFYIFYFLLKTNKNIWTKIIKFVPPALVVMQSVALISIFSGVSVKSMDTNKDYLSTADFTTYSSKKNTLVFVLDRLDYEFIDEVLNDDPDFFNQMDGFTSYTNAISEHARTRPALNFLLTGCEDGLWEKPADEFFDDSWSSKINLLDDLNSADYKVDIYTEIDNIFGNIGSAVNYVSNYSCNANKLNKKQVIKNLMTLSAYRYAPITMRPFFWCYTDTVNKGIFKDSIVYEVDELQYADKISDFKLEKNKYFKLYHFNGSHPPYVLNEDGTKDEKGTSSLEQTKGAFNILFSAFRKMKEQGIYKDAAIIITADYGSALSDTDPVQKATTIGLFYKPTGSADTPLETSRAPVSLKNIPATIAKSAGLNTKKYGAALDEVGEDENVTRFFYKGIINDYGTEIMAYKYEINGDASNFNNWKIINEINVKESHSFY